MYDIIGDIHGHANELNELLELLGYRQRNGSWHHSTRKAVFVGDFIDRGPQIREVLQIVRPMVEAGGALAVMGNHEFNALAYHTQRPNEPDQFLRPHIEKNVKQHAETVRQVPPEELDGHLSWFRTLPMWLELDGLRVVHACWDGELISVIRTALQQHEGVTEAFLVDAMTCGTKLYHAIDAVLKGKELPLPENVKFRDKDGHARSHVRVRWFDSPAGRTFCDYALASGEEFPDIRVPQDAVDTAVPYEADEPPVFFGHYWLRADKLTKLTPNVACVDYSVAKGGCLCAYRWDGEHQLDDQKFVTVDARD